MVCYIHKGRESLWHNDCLNFIHAITFTFRLEKGKKNLIPQAMDYIVLFFHKDDFGIK